MYIYTITKKFRRKDNLFNAGFSLYTEEQPQLPDGFQYELTQVYSIPLVFDFDQDSLIKQSIIHQLENRSFINSYDRDELEQAGLFYICQGDKYKLDLSKSNISDLNKAHLLINTSDWTLYIQDCLGLCYVDSDTLNTLIPDLIKFLKSSHIIRKSISSCDKIL